MIIFLMNIRSIFYFFSFSFRFLNRTLNGTPLKPNASLNFFSNTLHLGQWVVYNVIMLIVSQFSNYWLSAIAIAVNRTSCSKCDIWWFFEYIQFAFLKIYILLKRKITDDATDIKPSPPIWIMQMITVFPKTVQYP